MTQTFKAKTPHYNERKPVLLIVHGIGTSLEDAENIFTGNSEYEASTHYFITQTGEVRQYLDETARAYHAGVSYWSGITDINSISLGIELEGNPVITDEKDFHLVSYNKTQMQALSELIKSICDRNKILPHNILGHQDISPYRKKDPGPHFDWKMLADNGVGLWHDLEKPAQDVVIEDKQMIAAFMQMLTLYGYDPRPAPEGHNWKEVVTAFQMHFLPWNICGLVTQQSIQALDILLDKKFK